MSRPADNPMDDRVLALAGLVQALRQVRQIAETGQADSAILSTATDSVFRVDAQSPADVYGDERALLPGMQLLFDYFSNSGDARDELLPRVAVFAHADGAGLTYSVAIASQSLWLMEGLDDISLP